MQSTARRPRDVLEAHRSQSRHVWDRGYVVSSSTRLDYGRLMKERIDLEDGQTPAWYILMSRIYGTHDGLTPNVQSRDNGTRISLYHVCMRGLLYTIYTNMIMMCDWPAVSSLLSAFGEGACWKSMRNAGCVTSGASAMQCRFTVQCGRQSPHPASIRSIRLNSWLGVLFTIAFSKYQLSIDQRNTTRPFRRSHVVIRHHEPSLRIFKRSQR